MITKVNEIIDVSDKIHELIYRDRILIRHPHAIEPRVLEGFLGSNNQENVVLVNGEVTTHATLLRVNDNSMVVKLCDESLRFDRHQSILAVFNHSAYDKIFLLQTTVEKIIFSEYWLKYIDPRFDKRYKFPLPTPVKFYLMPPTFYRLIKNREVQIIRHKIVQKEGDQEKVSVNDDVYHGINLNDSRLKDLELSTDNFHPDYKSLLARILREGTLKDISLGGVCLAVTEEPYQDSGLILLHLEISSHDAHTPTLSLKMLGAMRGISKKNEACGIHVAFLKRLDAHPSDFIFTKLEDHYSETKHSI
jgi:hypothetical protein